MVLVDDGIATGGTIRAAIQALRRAGARSLLLAVPVAPASAIASLRPSVDGIVCLSMPAVFRAVGLHYRDFEQTSDAEVMALLGRARARGSV
ncbi:putative phosphoribosyl transferase [compost metagenome]